MSVPGGIRAKLMLALLAIIGGALAGAFLIVVPSLERRLVDAKLEILERDTASTASAIVANDIADEPDAIASLGAAFGARIVLYDVVEGPSLAVLVDTANPELTAGMERDPIALAALEGVSARGRVTRGGTQYAEVATQLLTGEVLLLSGSLTDQLSTVGLVKRRLLIASIVAVVGLCWVGTR